MKEQLTEGERVKRENILGLKYPLVKRYLRLFGIPEQFHDDITQEVLLSAYRAIDKLHDIDKMDSWLYSITLRKSVRYLNQQRTLMERETHYTPEEFEESLDLAEAAIFDGSKESFTGNDRLKGMVLRLKEPARSILKLRFDDGFSLKEIAGILDMNYNTVKTIQSRAFKIIKKEWERNGGGDKI